MYSGRAAWTRPAHCPGLGKTRDSRIRGGVAPVSFVDEMIQHLPPHPQRDVLTGELHARPPLPLQTPVAISRLALSGEAGGERGAGVAHLAALCRRYA